jgi:hypothetical protein
MAQAQGLGFGHAVAIQRGLAASSRDISHGCNGKADTHVINVGVA